MAKLMCTQRTLVEEVARLERQREEASKAVEQRYDRDVLAAETTFLVLQELQALGLVLPVPQWSGDSTEPLYTVDDKRDFRHVHKVVGELEEYDTSPADPDARKRLVWRVLKPKAERYSHIRFRYQVKLSKTAKCKVKRVRNKAYSYTTVVCDSAA